jgi:hypothetical protein
MPSFTLDFDGHTVDMKDTPIPQIGEQIEMRQRMDGEATDSIKRYRVKSVTHFYDMKGIDRPVGELGGITIEWTHRRYQDVITVVAE